MRRALDTLNFFADIAYPTEDRVRVFLPSEGAFGWQMNPVFDQGDPLAFSIDTVGGVRTSHRTRSAQAFRPWQQKEQVS